MRLRRQRRWLVEVIWMGALAVVTGAGHPAVAEVTGTGGALPAAFTLALALVASVLIVASGGVRRRHPRRR